MQKKLIERIHPPHPYLNYTYNLLNTYKYFNNYITYLKEYLYNCGRGVVGTTFH